MRACGHDSAVPLTQRRHSCDAESRSRVAQWQRRWRRARARHRHARGVRRSALQCLARAARREHVITTLWVVDRVPWATARAPRLLAAGGNCRPVCNRFFCAAAHGFRTAQACRSVRRHRRAGRQRGGRAACAWRRHLRSAWPRAFDVVSQSAGARATRRRGGRRQLRRCSYAAEGVSGRIVGLPRH